MSSSGNPYQQGPSQETGYGYGQQAHEMQPYASPYAQQQHNPPAFGGQQHQSPYASAQPSPYAATNPPQAGPGQAQPTPYGPASSGAKILTSQEFLSRVTSIRNEFESLSTKISHLANIHQRALGGTDSQAQRDLEDAVTTTQVKNTAIKGSLSSLLADVNRTSDPSLFGMKKRQFESLKADYEKKLREFQEEERRYRERYRDQIARQYRIVNPNATEQEVAQAQQADWGNEGIFQTALKNNRTAQANAVLGNVRERHNELQKIEQQLMDLAAMFQDLEMLVVEQDPIIHQAEEAIQQTNVHLEDANVQVNKGIKHARSRRKLKWWCLFISILVVIAIALGVGLGVYFNMPRNSSNNNNNNPQ